MSEAPLYRLEAEVLANFRCPPGHNSRVKRLTAKSEPPLTQVTVNFPRQYTGEWAGGQRQGIGRFEYSDGNFYAGAAPVPHEREFLLANLLF